MMVMMVGGDADGCCMVNVVVVVVGRSHQ